MKIRIGDATQVFSPLGGGQETHLTLGLELDLPDDAADAEIAAAARRLTRTHRLVSVERYWETRALLIENGVDPDSSRDEQLDQAGAEAEKRGGHL